VKKVWAGLLFVAAAAGWYAATRDDTVRTRPTSQLLVAAPPRLGINLGGWSFWGADQFGSNILKNPGFEGLIDGAIAIPQHVSDTSFDDSSPSLARADSFWDGARYSILSGAGAGREGRVIHSSQSGARGLPSYGVRSGDPLPAPGDAVALVRESDAELPAQWWYTRDRGNRFGPEARQTRPGSSGRRSLRVGAEGGSPAVVSSYLDSIGERAGNLLPLEGSWELCFWARLDRGSARLRVHFGREKSTPLIDRELEVGPSWTQVRLPFSGSDSGTVGTIGLSFEVRGSPDGDILLDDVDLRRDGDRGFPFRREVVEALERIRPGYLRDWQGQLGDTLENRTAPAFARRSYRYRPGDREQSDYGYGLRDFLDLCVRIHASPWIVAPTISTEGDCAGLGDYLSKQSDLASLPEILVEFGNENWNTLFRPAGIPDPLAHGHAADRCFAALKQHGPATLRTIVNAHVADRAGALAFARSSGASDILALAPYYVHSLAAGLPLRNRLSQVLRGGDLPALDGIRQEIAVYEVNAHAVDGDATASERLPVVGGIASAAALARTMMEAMAGGARRQCAYSLTGFESRLSSQPGEIPLWGMVRDLGPTRRFRPTGLALQLLNEAILGDLVAMDRHGARDVAAYAFQSGREWSQVLVSASLEPRRVVVGVPAGVATVNIRELLADSIEATNEERERVRIQSRSAVAGPDGVALTLPPAGIVVVRPGR
jgi:hypothetical protein